MSKKIIILIGLIWSIIVLGGCTQQTQNEIKIGSILTLSGQAAPYGQSAKNAIEMGINEINENNLIGNKKISIIYEDDQLDPKTGVNAFRKLVDIDHVKVVIGPLTSSVALAIVPIANEKKVVLLSPSASSPNLSQAGAYFFRNVASDEFETKIMAQYAFDSMHITKVGMIYINNDFGLGYKIFFEKFFNLKGGQLVRAESYEQGQSDFRSQLSKLKSSKVEAIYLIGYKEMGNILRQATEIGIKTQFFSYSGIEDPDIVKLAGNASNGLVYTRQSFDPNDPSNNVKKFSDSYRKLYSKDPDPYAALSYDAIMILAKAIKEGGEDSEGIKDTIHNIKDYPGVTGRTTFDANGNVTKSISIKKIENGHD